MIIRFSGATNVQLEQRKDIPKEMIPKVIDGYPIVERDSSVSRMPNSPLVVFAKQPPSYSVAKDTINMPNMKKLQDQRKLLQYSFS